MTSPNEWELYAEASEEGAEKVNERALEILANIKGPDICEIFDYLRPYEHEVAKALVSKDDHRLMDMFENASREWAKDLADGETEL